MKLRWLFLFVSVTAFAADDPYAASIFQKHCAACHNSEAGASGRIPQLPALKSMTPAAIQKTLEAGVMKTQAAALSPDERQRIASFLGTAVTLERKRDEIANVCPAGAAWREGPAWSGWGADLANTRFQSQANAGLRAEDVPKLKLKWAFAFPDASTMRSQPAIYRGRIFAGGQDGSVYALDMRSGCVYWSTTVQSQVRSGITVGDDGHGPAIFFGDSAGFVYALDAATGKQLWKVRPDEHAASTVTATPVFFKDRLFVGSASREESLSVTAGYPCCTFRGSESALDVRTGKIVWKTYMIAEAAKPQPKTKQGASTWGPSGAGVWNAPVLDSDRGVLYVATGDNYSDPPTAMSDALVSLRISDGHILWSKQFTAKDAWNSSCQLEGKVNCPDSEGPDFDFASSPILISLPNGRRALLLGQKSAVIYAADPDKRGEILWKARVGAGGTVGGIEWGSATDGHNVYVALSDITFEVARKPGSNDRAYNLDSHKGGGLFAFRVDNGERMWQASPPGCGDRPACSPAQSAAVTAIPGVVWSGSVDGHLRGYATSTGRIIWDYDTAHEYRTVNGLPGRGGAIDVAGPVIADGMLFTVSGYPARGGLPGNVLLAFGLDEPGHN